MAKQSKKKSKNELTTLFLNQIENKLKDELIFSLFFKEINVELVDNKSLKIIFPSKEAVNQAKNSYLNLIKSIAKDILPDVVNILFFSIDEKADINNSNEKILFSGFEPSHSRVNPNLNFDVYIAGSFNESIISLRKKLFINPDIVYSPIFIYGRSGYGKTHFLHAIGNVFLDRGQSACFISANDFTNSFIKILGSNNQEKINNFISGYKKYDVLLFDDIQQYASRYATLNVLFNLMNYFIENKKQIFICSDKDPQLLGGFEERFITRFQGGLVFEIKTPNSEDYIKIVKKKLQQQNFKIEDWSIEAIEFIARNYSGSIRSVEGAINKIIFFALDKKIEYYDQTIIKEIFKNEDLKKEHITPERIIKKTCEYYNISKTNMISKSRKKEIVVARSICMWLLKELLNLKLKEIGSLLGDRNHTTVIFGLKNVEKELKVNNAVDFAVKAIKQNIAKAS